MAPRRGDLPPSAFIERKSASRASSFDDLERNFDARDADREHQRQGQTPYLTHPSQKFDNRQPDTTQSKRVPLEAPISHAALRLAGITKRYRSNTVLGPIDLSLEEGRIYGLIGENGAGKSTLIRIVMGLSKPTNGTVELIGRRGSAGLRNARSNIGYVPDSSASYPLLSAADNLKARCLEWGLDQRQIPHILDMIGLADAGNKRARSFSLGMRKRLDLGIALLGQPSMLVLDEPTNGLDPLGTIEIRELIKRLNRERGTTVLISSHNLAELHQTATDYVILSGGKLMAELTAGDIERLSGGDLEKLYTRIMMGHHNGPCRGEAAPQHLRRPSKPISTSGDDRDVR